jgi:hypothetical protein
MSFYSITAVESIANGDLAVNVASEEDRGSDGGCGSGGGEFLAHGDIRL